MYSHKKKKNISSNQFFSKNVTFTKFLSKLRNSLSPYQIQNLAILEKKNTMYYYKIFWPLGNLEGPWGIAFKKYFDFSNSIQNMLKIHANSACSSIWSTPLTNQWENHSLTFMHLALFGKQHCCTYSCLQNYKRFYVLQ